MSAGAATDPYSRMQIRIPGWLLLIALVVLVGWWGTHRYSNASGDRSSGEFRFPGRFTALESSFENRVLTATVLIESDDAFQPSAFNVQVVLDDHHALDASVRVVGPGPWHDRSYIVALDRLIPEGRTPIAVQFIAKNGMADAPLRMEAAP